MAAKGTQNYRSVYAGTRIFLTTKHAKSIAIAPPFLEKLGACVLEHITDTDLLGTFSGEIVRQGNALECARRKCEWSFNELGDSAEFALASEGSFGPHPLMPFLPCDHEILYFIDRQRAFHLHLTHLSEKTNYRMGTVDTITALENFADQVLFPSHALILRPNMSKAETPIFKGLNSVQALEKAFEKCINDSIDGKVWVETDMRAQFNPSRMQVIGELATNFAKQLCCHCPNCDMPGWGKIRLERGLECGECRTKTELVKSQIFGCVKCDYEEKRARDDGISEADPGNCQFCNP